MSGSSIYKSLGHHAHWGFSAAFDVLEATAGRIDKTEKSHPLNILLFHPGDIRHIIHTISRKMRHKNIRPIHFYIVESTVETLARDITLLELLNDYNLPIRQRATVFLEIYGNCRVQKRTSEYIEKLGQQVKHLVATGNGVLANVVNFDLLRYRERDDLELATKLYGKTVPFDIQSLLDHRYRGLYEDRFDSRKALCDWDYQYNIKGKASIVHIKQYKEWRLTGTAFEFGDQSYTEPNRTMMSYTEGTMKRGKEQGMKKEVSRISCFFEF
jgi:dynein assembly factor 3